MNWVNIYRACLHVPVGWFNGLALDVGPMWASMFFLGFIAYEINEDWGIKDGAYLDIYGWLIGFAIMIAWKWVTQ